MKTNQNKHESIEKIRVKNSISNDSELHAFEIFKLIVTITKNQPISEVFSSIIADSDPNAIMRKRNCAQYVQAGRQRLDSNSLNCKVLVMLKMELNYKESFVDNVRTIKEATIKGFCHTFLDLYIIGN